VKGVASWRFAKTINFTTRGRRGIPILVVIYTRWPKSQSQICDIDSEPRGVEGLGQEVDGGRRIELHIGDPKL
jgi:hypothetical protein